MALATTVKFGNFIIRLGNGASPEVFTAPCGLTTKSLTFTKDLNEVIIPDCDDPDAMSWVGRDAISLSAAISGDGVLAVESVEAWLDALESSDSVSVEIEIIWPAKTITWTGLMHISSFAVSAERANRATAAIEMASDGEMVRVVTP